MRYLLHSFEVREDVMKLKAIFTVLVGIIFLSVPAPAQSGRMRGEEKGSQQGAVRLRAEEVLLPISARTDLGKLVEEIKPSELIVAEDDKRQQVTSVLRMPANLLLIVDTSGREVAVKSINKNRELALKIIESLGSKDQAAIITYADTVNLVSDWTSSKEELRQAVNEKFRPGLESRLYESLLFAARDVLSKVEGRRDVVLITDGVDTFNADLLLEAMAALHRARATVYVISQSQIILDDIEPRAYNALSWYERLDPQQNKRIQQLRRYAGKIKAGRAVMGELADATGGVVWIPASDEEFLKTDRSIMEEMETEFIVSYVSERREDDEEAHRVNVYSSNPHIKIRSRSKVYSNRDETKGREPAAPASKN